MEYISLNGKDYKVLKLLGKGKGGYSYLVQYGENRFVLKQIHHEPCSYYSFGDKLQSELNDYAKLADIGIKIPKLLEFDRENERILKEYIEGPLISELAKTNSVKEEYFAQMYKMCELLYAKSTNIDYYPTNFVVQNEVLYYIDFECNPYMEEWSFEKWGIKYWGKTLETDRLLLRRFIKSDLDDLYEILSDEEVVRYKPYKPMDKCSTEESLAWRISTSEMIAIEKKEERKVIGNIYLGIRDNNSLEIGYLLNKKYWHLGLAKEAILATVNDAFLSGVDLIYAECDPKNEASWHLLEAVGFVRKECLKNNVYFFKDENGNPIFKDTLIYELKK